VKYISQNKNYAHFIIHYKRHVMAFSFQHCIVDSGVKQEDRFFLDNEKTDFITGLTTLKVKSNRYIL
jgi:hypothetical protein